MLRLTTRLVLFLVFIVLCILISFGSALVHNFKLNQYAKSFDQIDHPPNTSLVEAKRLVSGYEGKGNCVYFVGQLRKYWSPREEIEAYYSMQMDEEMSSDELELLFIDEEGFIDTTIAYQYPLPWDVREASDWSIPSLDTQERLYLVFISSTGAEFLDFRCK